MAGQNRRRHGGWRRLAGHNGRGHGLHGGERSRGRGGRLSIPGEKRARVARRQIQRAGRDEDEHFCFLGLFGLVPRQITDNGQCCGSRPAAETSQITRSKNSRKNRRLVLPQAHRLLDRAVAQNGNAIDGLTRETADIELKLQRHFIAAVQPRRRLHAQSQVHILRGRICRLPEGGGG